jgi:subtilisin family serine protease
MSRRFGKVRLVVLVPALLSLNSAFAMNPNHILDMETHAKTAKRAQAIHTLKTNSKGTILESTNAAFATPENWFNLDPKVDDIQGVSSDKVYTEFGEPTATEDIIVAVIDSGVDVNHEDLQGKIWINTKEIADNGIDDDNNGYIDDIFGWNFIGAKDGMAKIVQDGSLKNSLRLEQGDKSKQISADSLEVTREYARLLKLKAELATINEYLLPQEVALLEEVKKEVEENKKTATTNLNFYTTALVDYNVNSKILIVQGGLTIIDFDTVDAFVPTTIQLVNAKEAILKLLNRGLEPESIESEIEYYNTQANFYYNEKLNIRSLVVGDDNNNPNEKNYGNNNVIGPDAFHGTHVAGIIAANRENTIGIKGVAKKVKIMALRAVPNGDERDKDIANSIRYAVDNGAKVINMSFGKSYSPHKSVVDSAVKYAQEKGVLLVHAAGNSYTDNDKGGNFPNRVMLSDKSEVNNWLEIGASSYSNDSSFAAGFSNYGKKTVDIFAPGVNIFSTIPGNEYSNASGTSMASPATAGVAALVLSFSPKLEAKELKEIIISTTNRFPGLKVFKARVGEVLFSQLSIHGGTPNAFEAVKAVVGPTIEPQVKAPTRRSWLGRLLRRNKGDK